VKYQLETLCSTAIAGYCNVLIGHICRGTEENYE